MKEEFKYYIDKEVKEVIDLSIDYLENIRRYNDIYFKDFEGTNFI